MGVGLTDEVVVAVEHLPKSLRGLRNQRVQEEECEGRLLVSEDLSERSSHTKKKATRGWLSFK